jgi:hypothetical protein
MSQDTFAALGVSAELTAVLEARGIGSPFQIQTRAIPPALAGTDLLAKSPTGSGKTLAFAIPLVERAPHDEARPAALVLVPTRELAVQVTEEIQTLATARGLSVATVYGGVALRPRSLPRGASRGSRSSAGARRARRGDRSARARRGAAVLGPRPTTGPSRTRPRAGGASPTWGSPGRRPGPRGRPRRRPSCVPAPPPGERGSRPARSRASCRSASSGRSRRARRRTPRRCRGCARAWVARPGRCARA